MRSLKSQVQALLKRTGVYHRLRASTINELYWRLTGARGLKARNSEIVFYRNLLTELRPGDLIFDVGANVGFKTDLFLRLGAKVVAVEPDEQNESVLRERFLRFRRSPKPVVIVGMAVSDTNATATIWIDGPGSAVNTLSQKWASILKGNKARHTYGHCGLEFAESQTVATTTLEQLMAEYGCPVFIKIDVEGHELNVIRGLRRPVPCLSYEVNLPEFRPEAVECVELLRRLAGSGKFNYATDCEQGLALDRWVGADEFLYVLEQCREGAIEVFWKGLTSEAPRTGTGAEEHCASV